MRKSTMGAALLASCAIAAGATLPAVAIDGESGSISCSSNSAAVTARGSGYIYLRAPGASTTWTSPYHQFTTRETATIFRDGSWSASASKYYDDNGSYPYCR